MTQTLLATQLVAFLTAPVDASGNVMPSPPTLANFVFTSSDPTIFTVAADPAHAPNGGIVTAVAVGTGTLTITAQATEVDGTVHTIQGVATITVTAAPTHAAALSITFGTPTAKPTTPPTPTNPAP